MSNRKQQNLKPGPSGKKKTVFTYALIGEPREVGVKEWKSVAKIRDTFTEEELNWIMKNKRFLVWVDRGWWEEHAQPYFPTWTLQTIFLSPKQIIIIPFEA